MKKLKNALKPLCIVGLIVGTLDGLAATVMYAVQSGKDPMNVFRFIASGVFGPNALNGGVPMALAGIVFHYGIAFCWTVLFFWLAIGYSFLRRNWIIAGIIYGIFIWIIMNNIVIPLSLIQMKTGPREWASILKGMVILIVCVGIPVSYSARKYHSAKL